MTELARGNVSDRPWGRTLGALALRGLSGQLTLTSDGKAYCVAFARGIVVGASSPLASDSAARVALTSHLVSSSQVGEIARRLATAPDRDEVDVIAELAKLSPEQAQRLRRRVNAQRAARTFSVERGEFVVDDQVALPIISGGELDIRTIVYLGAVNNLVEERLSLELGQMGGYFKLRPEATPDLALFGFSETDRAVVVALRDGANLAEVLLAHPEVDGRTIRAIAYSLVSCGAADATEPVNRTTTAIPRLRKPPSRPPIDQPTDGATLQRDRASTGAPVAMRGSSPTSGATAVRQPRGSSPTSGATAVPRPRGSSPTSGATAAPRAPSGSTAPATQARTATGDRPVMSRASSRDNPPTPSRTTTPPPIGRTPTAPPVSRTMTPPPISRTSTPPSVSRTTTPPPMGRALTGPPASRTTTPPPFATTPTGDDVVRLRPPSGAPPTQMAKPRPQRSSSQPPITRVRRDSAATRETEALIVELVPRLDSGADYFTLLGVPVDSAPDAVRGAYFTLARKLHPDRLAALGIPDARRDAQRLFAAINTAFATLSDPQRRSDYVTVLRRGGEAAVRAEDAKADQLAMRVMRAEEAFKLGEMALRRDQLTTAIAEFTTAVELQPNESEYTALLAWSKFAAAPDKMAVAAATRGQLSKAAAQSEKSVTARFYLGRVERMLGREREALEIFQRVLADKPHHADAKAEVRILESRLKSKR